jgi:hypothetical protein
MRCGDVTNPYRVARARLRKALSSVTPSEANQGKSLVKTNASPSYFSACPSITMRDSATNPQIGQPGNVTHSLEPPLPRPRPHASTLAHRLETMPYERPGLDGMLMFSGMPIEPP